MNQRSKMHFLVSGGLRSFHSAKATGGWAYVDGGADGGTRTFASQADLIFPTPWVGNAYLTPGRLNVCLSAMDHTQSAFFGPYHTTCEFPFFHPPDPCKPASLFFFFSKMVCVGWAFCRRKYIYPRCSKSAIVFIFFRTITMLFFFGYGWEGEEIIQQSVRSLFVSHLVLV